MLCLSGFELHSSWVPLLRLISVVLYSVRGSLPKSVPLDWNSKKLLPYILTVNTTIHPNNDNNEIAVRMRKLFIFLPFPAFHCWTTVSGLNMQILVPVIQVFQRSFKSTSGHQILGYKNWSSLFH